MALQKWKYVKSIFILSLGLYNTNQAFADHYPQLSLGGNHTCALKMDKTVECWGKNNYGQLGNGTTTDSSTPIPVSSLTNVTAISAGYYHTCALIRDGTVECWGENNYGQLGNGTATNSSTPIPVSGLTNVTAVSAGGLHTCALINDGSVKCWGLNDSGQLGDGTTTNAPNPTPIPVSGLTNATAVSAGAEHTCALISDGAVQCWGHNQEGELGDGTTTMRLTPVSVYNIQNATAVSVGDNHACALINGGIVECWGGDYYGQLGDGKSAYVTSTPVSVSNLKNAAAISVRGGEHTCALITDGTIHCWGNNSVGDLGDGTTINSSTPVSVLTTGKEVLTNALEVSIGGGHACAVISLNGNNSIQCWGLNSNGQLGNGSTTNGLFPTNLSFP